MIKYEVDNAKIKHFEMSGNLPEITSDAFMIFRLVRDAIKEQNEEDAKNFEIVCKEAMIDGIVFASVKEVKKEIAKELLNILDDIRELIEIEEDDENDD